jgi:hypothetical protein
MISIKNQLLLIMGAVVMFSSTSLQASTKPDNRIFDPSKMTDTEMVSVQVNTVKHIYTSFINGWYQKSN